MSRGGAACGLTVPDHALVAAATPAVVEQGCAAHSRRKLSAQNAAVVASMPAAVALGSPRGCDLTVR